MRRPTSLSSPETEARNRPSEWPRHSSPTMITYRTHRQDLLNSRLMADADLAQKVWAKASTVTGYDPMAWRRDVHGNLIRASQKTPFRAEFGDDFMDRGRDFGGESGGTGGGPASCGQRRAGRQLGCPIRGQ